jgi:uncharacterized protein
VAKLAAASPIVIQPNITSGQLVVFARVPALGQVKTRLASVIGAPTALNVYRELLQHTLTTAARFRDQMPRTQLQLCICGDDRDFEMARLAQRLDMTVSLQMDGDLGRRMAWALNQALQQGPPAVLIGVDVPSLHERHLGWAFNALASHDAVFLPVADGGYSLVGLRAEADTLFDDISWSSDQVMSQTRQKLRKLGLRWAEGDCLWDVDTAQDLARWQTEQSAP